MYHPQQPTVEQCKPLLRVVLLTIPQRPALPAAPIQLLTTTQAPSGVVTRAQTEIPRGLYLPNREIMEQPQGFLFLRDDLAFFITHNLPFQIPIVMERP